MVWAILRILPNKEYLELEAHPLISALYTDKPKQTIKYRNENLTEKITKNDGKITHRKIITKISNTGPIK